MSSYLWRYYLENDADRFRQLLERSKAAGGHNASSNPRALLNSNHHHHGTPPKYAGITGKQKGGVKDPEAAAITKATFKELDDMGRNVLHMACTDPNKLEFVKALLAHPWVDTAVADAESAWTALHRALYFGNVSAAREIIAANANNWNLVKVKDKAGDAPFDLYGASMSDIEQILEEDMKQDKQEGSDDEEEVPETEDQVLQELQKGKGDEVFFWGSNKNLTLGFPDGDDRSYPERINVYRPKNLLLEQAYKEYGRLPANKNKAREELLDAKILFNPVSIRDIYLSKFHSAILTEDPHSNLFVCGFGHGGRLGLGDEQNTQFTFRPIEPPLLPKKKVMSVALGIDHTVIVLEDGEVWTWGSNKFGQLGYNLERRNPKEEPIQTTPQQVFGVIKKEYVVGCSASRVHTAVWTSDGLFTWGKNEGQLGILNSSDSRTLEVQTQPRKVSANFLQDAVISQVVAIDAATVILLNNRDVWILAGHGYSKISFPIERFVGLPSSRTKVTRYDASSNSMRKITGGGDMICALSEDGDVFSLNVSNVLKMRAEKGPSKAPWISQHIWSTRKRHLAARDVDVGTDGNIILCTDSGSAWKRVRRVKTKETGPIHKFERIPGLTRITAVRSNTIGAYAALRKDTHLMRKGLTVDPQTLWDDVADQLPFTGLFGMSDDEGETDDYEDLKLYARPRYHAAAGKMVVQKDFQDRLRAYISENSANHEDYDAYITSSKVKDLEIPVHRVLLSRSPVLRKVFVTGCGSLGDMGSVRTASDGTVRVILNVDFLTLVNVVYYIYTDTPLDLFGLTPAKAASCRTETAHVGSALGLALLADAIGGRSHTPRSLDRDLRNALQDPDFEATADICLDLEDGELYVHSLFMRIRCPLFDTLYGGGHGVQWLMGRNIEDDESHVHVDMKHVRKDIMEKVVAWLYTDYGEEGFNGIRSGVQENNVDIFLDYMLEVLAVANELMLDRFSQICQKIIGKYVNTRNAAGLLNVISECSEQEFKYKCLQYMCLNLETMLENHLLDELEEDLMLELDNTVRSNQERCFPYIRKDMQAALLESRHPTMPEDQALEKQRRIDHYIALGEELVLRAAFKALAVSTSAQDVRRRSHQQGDAATADKPNLKQKKSDDNIFAMDEDVGAVPATPVDKGKTPVRGKPEYTPLPLHSPGPFNTPSPKTGGVAWATPVMSTSAPKFDLKEIMSQASAKSPVATTPTTPLTPGGSVPSGPAHFKKSQKERKRQQAIMTTTSTPTQDKKPAWNVDPSAQAPAASLKDILATPPPSATPSRRTTPATHKPSPSAPVFTPAPNQQPASSPAPLPAGRKSESHLKLTLQDIIDQEEAQKEFIKEYSAKRSLQEIQEEQEFLRWWEAEERRIKEEQEAAASGGKSGRGKKKGKRGGTNTGTKAPAGDGQTNHTGPSRGGRRGGGATQQGAQTPRIHAPGGPAQGTPVPGMPVEAGRGGGGSRGRGRGRGRGGGGGAPRGRGGAPPQNQRRPEGVNVGV